MKLFRVTKVTIDAHCNKVSGTIVLSAIILVQTFEHPRCSKRAFCTINGKCCPINRRSNRRCRSMYSVGTDSAIHDLFEYSFCWWTRGFKNSPRAGNMSGALFVASMRLRRDFAPHGFATIAGLPHCNSRIVALQQEQGIFCLCKTVSSYSLSLQSIRQASDERATCRICF